MTGTAIRAYPCPVRALTGLVLIVLICLLSASPALAQNGCGGGPPEQSLFLTQNGAGGGPPRQSALPAQQWELGDLLLAGALTALLATGGGIAVRHRLRRNG